MTLRSPRTLLLVPKCLEVSGRERLGLAVLAGEGGAGLLLSVVMEKLLFVF